MVKEPNVVKRFLLVTLAGWIFAGLAGCERPLQPALRASTENVSLLRASMGSDKAAAAATPKVLAQPTGFATISGTFKIDGNPPPPQVLVVDKEKDICMPGGMPVYSQALEIGSSGGIKNVVLFLATKYPEGDPAWEHQSYADTRDAVLEFDQKNCIFLTHFQALRSTQTLKVLNSDPVGHNTNISGGGRAKPENFTVAAGGSALYQPGGESAEPFDVACNIHPWMSAKMIVRNSPYFAVTKADGSFEIPNAPTGVELEFRVWQEKAGYLQEVTVNGAPTKWPKGRLKLTLTPDQPQTMDVVVNASAFSR